MEKDKLVDLDQQVEAGKKILKQIEELHKVAKSCRSEVGFMRINTMYRNDGEQSLIDILGSSKVVHETFRIAIGAAAASQIMELEKQFEALEIK